MHPAEKILLKTERERERGEVEVRAGGQTS